MDVLGVPSAAQEIATSSSTTLTAATRPATATSFLLDLLSSLARAQGDVRTVVCESGLSSAIITALAAEATAAGLDVGRLLLLRSLAEQPAHVLDAGLWPLLHMLLTPTYLPASRLAPPGAAHASASAASAASLAMVEEGALALLDTLYVSLRYARSLISPKDAQAKSSPCKSRPVSPTGSAPAAESAVFSALDGSRPVAVGHLPEAEVTALRQRVASLLASVRPILPLLLSPSPRLALRASHCLCLFAQLLGPTHARACCTALLVADCAPETLLELLDGRDAEHSAVVACTLKALAWLQRGEPLEYAAAVASVPALAESIERRLAEA